MSQVYTPVIRALVAGTLLAATAAVLHVTVQTARAAGALALGPCGGYGEAYDFRNADEARKSALVKCKGDTCRGQGVRHPHVRQRLAVSGHSVGPRTWA